MTQKHPTEYFKEVADITLPDNQKTQMREKLSAYADLHAVGGVTVHEDVRSNENIQHVSVWGLFTRRTQFMYLNATLLIALALGGGTAVAAEGALPGDTLYPVKVHVNENVRGALAIGANAEATLQTELLNERIEEAEMLAARGELEGDTATLVEANITAQAEAANEAVLRADSETQLAIRTDLAAALDRAEDEVTSLALDTAAHAKLGFTGNTGDAAMMSIELAGDLDLGTRVETADERVESLRALIAAEAALGADVQAGFESDLQVAAKHVEDAYASLEANNEAEAEASVMAAETIAGDIESALSLMGDVEIDTDTGAIIDIDVTEEASATSALDLGF